MDQQEKLAVKFFPAQDYVAAFFKNFKVAFSAPNVFNDCLEAYVTPCTPANYQIGRTNSPYLARWLNDAFNSDHILCFCCTKITNIYDLEQDKIEKMWAHYASYHRGIGVIFNRLDAIPNKETGGHQSLFYKRNSSPYLPDCLSGFDVIYSNNRDQAKMGVLLNDIEDNPPSGLNNVITHDQTKKLYSQFFIKKNHMGRRK